MSDYEELRDDTIAAFEDSTGDVPNDYEMANIEISVRDYLEEGK
jgi:hypothetical protein